MDTMSAFVMGQATRGDRMRVFDWEKAAERIRDVRPSSARAGLSGDWEWTGGEIWGGEAPVPEDDTYVYLASTWATPELEMDGEVEDCWRWVDESPGWNAQTYWPPEAIEVLKARRNTRVD